MNTLPNRDEFLSQSAFPAAADLDGKSAALFLIAAGCNNVRHADIDTNGLAVGVAPNGNTVALSTNGRFIADATAERLPRAARAGLI